VLSGKILAVDDSPTYLNALSDVLREDGYDVVTAQSGEEALVLLAVQRVDCIVLDLKMPGIGGHETCRRIKSAPVIRDTPLVILTAVEDTATMLEGLGAGADDFISKSSDFDVLRARVRAQIRRKRFEDEHRRIRDELLTKELEASEARAAKELASTRAILLQELEQKNRELEAFSYSVSHDLRAPLRSIDGFSQALVEDYGHLLDADGVGYLNRVRTAAQRMAALIDDMLELSRVGRSELRIGAVNVSQLAGEVSGLLTRADPDRTARFAIQPGIISTGDARMVRIVLDNLLGNAWKFTKGKDGAVIELGMTVTDGVNVHFVRDNGAGFSMDYAEKLFRPFQRLHTEAEFPGTGIGLATVQRIIDRHGGKVWAEGKVGEGATVYFTLGNTKGATE